MGSKKSAQRGVSRTPGEVDARSVEVFLDVLVACEPRPEPLAPREPKKAYSERLSNKIAVLIANKLRATGQFKGEILPSAAGRGREKPVPSGAFNKPKKTDVNFSTLSGLELLVSIKTLGFRDVLKTGQLGRYTKNMVRNDHELRAEAMEFHERYPYAVLAALFFIPRDACDDGENDKSSFAHAVMTFRARAGRDRPDEPAQMFELFYIGLYDWEEGPNRGRLEFFDVMDAPRRRGSPSKLVSLEQVIKRIVAVYGLRNRRYIPFEEDEAGGDGGVPQLSPAPEEDATSAEGSRGEGPEPQEGDDEDD
jgi:hypothetical protein